MIANNSTRASLRCEAHSIASQFIGSTPRSAVCMAACAVRSHGLHCTSGIRDLSILEYQDSTVIGVHLSEYLTMLLLLYHQSLNKRGNRTELTRNLGQRKFSTLNLCHRQQARLAVSYIFRLHPPFRKH